MHGQVDNIYTDIYTDIYNIYTYLRRFLETLQGEDYVAMWRGSVLLAAACLLVTSKLVSVSPLPAKLLLHYSGQAFSMEELTVSAEHDTNHLVVLTILHQDHMRIKSAVWLLFESVPSQTDK